MTIKVMQTATVGVEIIVNSADAHLVAGGLAALGAITNGSLEQPFTVKCDTVYDWRDYDLMYVTISYTAKGANRNDIYRRVADLIEADFVRVEPFASIKKL